MASIFDVNAQRSLGGADAILAVEARYAEQFVIEVQGIDARNRAIDLTDATFAVAVELTSGKFDSVGRFTEEDAPRTPLATPWEVLSNAAALRAGKFQLAVPAGWAPANPEPGAAILPVALVVINCQRPSDEARELVGVVACRYGSERDLSATPVGAYVDGVGVNFTWNLDLSEIDAAPTPVPSGETITLSNDPPPPVSDDPDDASAGTSEHAMRGDAVAVLSADARGRLLPDAETGQIAVKQADGTWAGEAKPTGGGSGTAPTADSILDLAKSPRTPADRGKAWGVSDTDEDAAELLVIPPDLTGRVDGLQNSLDRAAFSANRNAWPLEKMPPAVIEETPLARIRILPATFKDTADLTTGNITLVIDDLNTVLVTSAVTGIRLYCRGIVVHEEPWTLAGADQEIQLTVSAQEAAQIDAGSRDYLEWLLEFRAGAGGAGYSDRHITPLGENPEFPANRREQRVLVDAPASDASVDRIIVEDSQLFATRDVIVHEATPQQVTGWANQRFDLGYFGDESALDATFYVVGRYYYNFVKYTPRVVAYISGNSGPKHWVDANAGDLVTEITGDVGHFLSDAEAAPYIQALGNVYYNERERRYRRATAITPGTGEVTAKQRLRQANEDDLGRIDDGLRDMIEAVLQVSPQHIDIGNPPEQVTMSLLARKRTYFGNTVRFELLGQTLDLPYVPTGAAHRANMTFSPAMLAAARALGTDSTAAAIASIRQIDASAQIPDDELANASIPLKIVSSASAAPTVPALTQAQQIGLLKYSSSPNHIQYAHVAELTGTLVMSVDNPELLTGDVWYVRKMNEAPIAGGARTKWTSTTFSIDFPIPNTNQFRTAMANSFRPGAGGSALELEFYDAATGGNGLGRIRSYVGGTQALVPTELASRATYDALGTKLNNRLYHWPDQPLEDPPVKGGAAIGGRVIGEGNILTQAQTALLLRRAAATAFTTLPDAGTLSWDVDDAGTLAQVTLGGAPRNFQPLINSRVGDTLILRVVQDATGGRVITWHGDYKFIGGAVTLNAAANAVTWLRLTVVGANEVLIGYLFAAGAVDALPRSGGTMTGALTLAADPTSALQAATKQYVDDNVGTGGGEGGSSDLPTLPAMGSRNNKLPRFVGNSLRWVLESVIVDDPDTPLAASADTVDVVLFRGRSFYETTFIHSTLPTASYRDFGAGDLPRGYTWGGARQVSGGGVVNTVIYSIPGGHFLRRISFGGRLDWGGYNPPNWHGAFASEADATANVNNVGDIVFFDGRVQVVTSYTPGVVGGYVWEPIESLDETARAAAAAAQATADAAPTTAEVTNIARREAATAAATPGPVILVTNIASFDATQNRFEDSSGNAVSVPNGSIVTLAETVYEAAVADAEFTPNANAIFLTR